MKNYNDFPSIEKVDWTMYKIVVPTEKDRQELKEAFEHIHYADIDTDYVAVNQLAHEYLDKEHGDYTNNIIVDEEIFNKLNK